MLKGDLALFSLGEILQSLAINTHTGTLKIAPPHGEVRLICFQKGEIVYFADTGYTDRVPQIGEILVRMQIITAAQLEEALALQRGTKELLGEILVKNKIATEADLKKALQTQTLEGLYDLFMLKEGTFEFQMNVLPDELQAGIFKRVPIALNTNSVIMEGLRQVDEWNVMRRHVKTFDEIFRRVDLLANVPSDLSGLLLELCNGTRPVKELFKSYAGSRFECCKRLCGFADDGHIRALTEQECLDAAEERLGAKQFQQAAVFLTFASQLKPGSVSTLTRLGDALSGSFQEDAAKAVFVEALRLAYDTEDFQKVSELGERLQHRGNLEDADLERIFFSYVRLQNFKRAASTGNQLVTLRQKSGAYDKAAIVMEAIAAMDPNDLNLKIQAATLFEKSGNTELATRELEDVAKTLEREKKYRELLKILRLVAQLNPKRQDLRQKIASTQALIELLARRKKFRVTVAGVSSIGLLLLGVVPFLYEIKARECFSHAQRLEQGAMLSLDFGRAKEAYATIVNNYCFSTKVAEAQEGLARISHVERTYLARAELQAAARKEEQETRMYALKEELSGKLKEAEEAEKAADFRAAHSIYRQITTDYAEIPAVKNVLFPLRIDSDPPAATVSIDGVERGKTPYVYRYKLGTSINLTLARSSCATLQQSVELTDQWQLNFKLERKPLGEFSPIPSILEPMAVAQKRLLIASRDGNLYGVDPASRISRWQRVVGRYGDRISDLEARGDEVYLGTVTGEVTAIAVSSGKSRWITKLSSSVLAAPAVSGDGKWVAVGTTSGLVHVISNETGTVVGKFATENEITAKPLFLGSFLFVGSTDNYVYAYSLEQGSVVGELELSGDAAVDLTPDGSTFLTATPEGNVYRIDGNGRSILWSKPLTGVVPTAIAVTRAGIHVGTTSGRLVTLDRETGALAWELMAGKGSTVGLLSSEKLIYATLESGQVVAVEASRGALAWSYQSDVPTLVPPVLLDGVLYLAGITGKIQFLEVLE